MNSKIDREYLEIVSDLLRDSAVLSMNDIKQHVEGFSCLDHSIFVSYVSYKLCKKWGLDYVSAARAGLLHDLHLCNWDEMDLKHWERLCQHPKMACKNAERFGLNDLEREIIVSHMWPINLTILPKHKESVAVSLADKICASAEFMRIHKFLATTKRLYILNRRRTIPVA